MSWYHAARMISWTNPKTSRTHVGLKIPAIGKLVDNAIMVRFGMEVLKYDSNDKHAAHFYSRLRLFFRREIPPYYGRNGKTEWAQRLNGQGFQFEAWMRKRREEWRAKNAERRAGRERLRALAVNPPPRFGFP